jgi:leader peptidase (prepilin peptidase) / N-methyltransferase
VLTFGAALLGGLVGALFAVPAYRLSVETGNRATCATCDRRLGWVGRGRCGGCAARLGPRPWLLAAVGAAFCAGLAARLGLRPELAPLTFVVLLGVLLAAVDLAAERLPDVLVLPGTAVAVAGFTLIAALTGEWGDLGRGLLAGLAYAAGGFVMALLPGAPLGLGDVKLALLLGLCLGWFGWPLVFAGVLLAWVVNLPFALVMLVRRGRKGSLPFGPAMLAGAYLAIVVLVPLIRNVPAAGSEDLAAGHTISHQQPAGFTHFPVVVRNRLSSTVRSPASAAGILTFIVSPPCTR